MPLTGNQQKIRQKEVKAMIAPPTIKQDVVTLVADTKEGVYKSANISLLWLGSQLCTD